jgi:two-component system sensor histidine kinase PilS (NtrC family)
MADRQRLKQVLLNVLANGIKYNRRGGTVTLSYQEVSADRFRIMVTDTGPGVAVDQRTRLFEPFHTTRAQGTGLGLYVVGQLCEANQARAEYFDPSGGGAGFRIVCADPRRAQYA